MENGSGDAKSTGKKVYFRGRVLDVDYWLNYVKQCRYIPEEEFRVLCNIIETENLRKPNVVPVQVPVTICGDIHGQFQDLMHLFKCGGSPEDSTYVFMGDYVDRGHYSLEVITYLFLLTLKYPGKVLLLRGNHESRRVSRQYNFAEDCFRRYRSQIAWKFCCKTFDSLPIGALINDRIFCVHGGLSPKLITIDQYSGVRRNIEVPYYGELCDILWSDPEETTVPFSINPRGAGYTFNETATKRFIDENAISLICRSHQLVNEGYRLSHGDRIATVWSAPNYCYRCGNRASILKFHDDELKSDVIYFDSDPEFTDTAPDRSAPPYFI